MGAALRGGNEVDVALLDGLAALGQPGQRPVHRLALARKAAREGRHRQDRLTGQGLQQVVAQPIRVAPLLLRPLPLVDERDFKAGTQHRLGTQQLAQAAHLELRRVEIPWFRPETHQGAGAVPAHRAHDVQVLDLGAMLEGHGVFLAVPPDGDLQPARKRVDHRHPHPVQATGVAVGLLGKLAACMQLGEDHLHPRDALFGVDVDRHATPVVDHRDRTIAVQGHLDPLGEAGQRLVHAVVDDLLRQMIRAGGVGIHARTLLHRLKPGEHLDGGGVVGVVAHAGRLNPRWTPPF